MLWFLNPLLQPETFFAYYTKSPLKSHHPLVPTLRVGMQPGRFASRAEHSDGAGCALPWRSIVAWFQQRFGITDILRLKKLFFNPPVGINKKPVLFGHPGCGMEQKRLPASQQDRNSHAQTKKGLADYCQSFWFRMVTPPGIEPGFLA